MGFSERQRFAASLVAAKLIAKKLKLGSDGGGIVFGLARRLAAAVELLTPENCSSVSMSGRAVSDRVFL